MNPGVVVFKCQGKVFLTDSQPYLGQSSHKDFENRSKNAVCQKNLEFYHTFLHCIHTLEKVGVRIKKLE